MPSPIGHALAGAAIAWAVSPGRPDQNSSPTELPDLKTAPARVARDDSASRWRFTAVCAALAVAPDLDLLYLPIHRTVTHSLTAVFLVTIIAAGVTGWVTGRMRWATALTCGAAYGSHVLLDWLGADASPPYGIQALWPFSDRWFVAPWPIFPGTERRSPLSARAMWINFKAATAEISMLGSLAAAVWWVRFRTLRGRGRW